jgi:hypothetical protein
VICPFMSTENKTVECKEDCMLRMDSDRGRCAIGHGAEYLEATYKAIVRLIEKTK